MIEKSKAGEIDSLLMAKAVLSKSAEKRMLDSKLLTPQKDLGWSSEYCKSFFLRLQNKNTPNALGAQAYLSLSL